MGCVKIRGRNPARTPSKSKLTRITVKRVRHDPAEELLRPAYIAASTITFLLTTFTRTRKKSTHHELVVAADALAARIADLKKLIVK